MENAFEKINASVLGEVLRKPQAELYAKLPAFYKAELAAEFGAGNWFPVAPLIMSVLTLVSIRAVLFLSPLEIPPAVVEGFRRVGFKWDGLNGRPHAGELAGCTACAYALPADTFEACPLCGGAIGQFCVDGSGIVTGSASVN